MGGFWGPAPRLGGVGLVFALASLGLPGFGNHIAEFLVLIGSFRMHGIITIFAASGLVLAAIYSLWIVQRVFQGKKKEGVHLADLTAREMGMMAVMIIVIIWLGFFPRTILKPVDTVLHETSVTASQDSPVVTKGGGQ